MVRFARFAPRPRGLMRGTMMDFPLTLPTILERSGKIFSRVEIVSRKPDKSIARTCYGEFYRRARRLAAAGDDFRYPQIDENDGAAMCFTSGTTGFSKGVIYSHRSLVLHSFACGVGEVFGMSQFDTVLPVAPMFHANAWGLPFACTMLG